MSTASERVNSALELIGATSAIKPARIEVINKTFTTLQQMLVLWNSQSIGTGITYPQLITDELGEPEQIQLAIDSMLAIKAAPYIQKSVSEEVRAMCKTQMQQLRNQFSPKPSTIYPGSMPIGSGNKTFPIGPTYYPESGESGNGLTTEGGVPITT